MAEQGAYERLVSEIERLLPAEGGWWVNDREKELIIHTNVSRDRRRSRNGGEYDFYTCFEPVRDGVLVYDATSCELHINGMGRQIIPCIVGLEGLRRIAASVGLRTTCQKFLKRKASFADLREAVEAAS